MPIKMKLLEISTHFSHVYGDWMSSSLMRRSGVNISLFFLQLLFKIICWNNDDKYSSRHALSTPELHARAYLGKSFVDSMDVYRLE